MATFVLVHGAFQGGWCYGRVARLLRSAGHDVYTPTLTGLGERSHLLGDHISLALHVQDIVNVIRCEDLYSVVLCGHSYGGMVISGVASVVGDRLLSLVYLDALIPNEGQSALNVMGSDATSRMLDLAKVNNGMIPPLPAASYNVNPADIDWVDRSCVAHPFTSLLDAVPVSGVKAIANKAFILATESNGFGRAMYNRVVNEPDWRTHQIDCGHDIMIDRPDDLARLLLEETTR